MAWRALRVCGRSRVPASIAPSKRRRRTRSPIASLALISITPSRASICRATSGRADRCRSKDHASPPHCCNRVRNVAFVNASDTGTAWLGISDSNCRIRARTIHLKQRDNSLGCGSRRSRFSRLSCCVSHSCGNDFGSCSTRRCATENPVEPDVILHSTSPLNRACMVVTDTEPERLALLPRQRHWPPRGLGGAARCCECRAPSTNSCEIRCLL